MPRANTDVRRTPLYETRARKPLSGGRVQGVDGSMWLYRSVPMGAVVDAKTAESGMKVGATLMLAMNELSQLSTSRGINRRLAQKAYREFHILLTNFPKWYQAPKGSPIAGYLNSAYRDTHVLDRRVLIGTRLIATTGDGSVSGFINSAQKTLFEGGTPESDYDKDYQVVSDAMSRAGLRVPEDDDFRAAEAWWNHGRNADTPVLQHREHMHYFRSMGSVQTAEREGLRDCEPWLDVPDHMAVTFCSGSQFDIGYKDVEDPTVWWVPELVERGARVISIRGTVEPPNITRQELKSQRRRVRNDIMEAAEKGKTDQAAREEAEAELDAIERAYDVNKKGMPPTLVDTSVIVGFAGVHHDISLLEPSSLHLHLMTNRQMAAWHETMLCSNVRSNSNLHDLPATTIAYSGLPNLSVVGDEDGALIGFTSDEQPVYLSPTAASLADSAPTLLVGAATGAGKTVLLQFIAFQHSMMGRPTVIIDPKEQSDLTSTVLLTGGKVVSFDDFTSSDGGLDPLTLYKTPQQGIPLATSMLFRVNPWGDDRRRTYEADIANAIRYGVEQGATATGQALRIALEDGHVAEEVVAPVFSIAQSFPMFRATCGMNPAQNALSVHDGTTLFMRGSANLSLPPITGNLQASDMDMEMRLSVNLLRMLVRGSITALAGRGGVLHMDEAWTIERSAPDELNEVGRLARSMFVLPILYTQTPSGPLNMGLSGYISRGLIGHISDKDEAAAGLALFNADKPGALGRVTADATLEGGNGLNWQSLKALRDPVTDRVVRGSMFYYADLKQRIAPVEVKLPDEFLKLASTRPDEVKRRLEQR